MNKKIAPAVMHAAYAPFGACGGTQTAFVVNLFASYFERREISDAEASRLMNGGLPTLLVKRYADPLNAGCPKVLYEDALGCVKYYTVSSQRRRAGEGLLEVLRILSEDDRAELMPKDIPLYPSDEQLAGLLSDLLWYAATQDAAMKPRKGA